MKDNRASTSIERYTDSLQATEENRINTYDPGCNCEHKKQTATHTIDECNI